MKIKEITYKRLVSFRDDEYRPANETFGLTAEVDDSEDWRECRDQVIGEVELELNQRGNLRDSTQALRETRDELERKVAYYRDILRENDELRALIHQEEIDDSDIPF